MTNSVDVSSSNNFRLSAMLAQQIEEEHFSTFGSIIYVMVHIRSDIHM
jgi:hypothetical protein